MADMPTYDEVQALAAQLSRADQLRLAQSLLGHGEAAAYQPRKGRRWAEIMGSVAHPLCGEDAQAWVSRSRAEADESREEPWRRSP